MPILAPGTALAIGAIVAPFLFLISMHFTRATRPRALAAIAASVAFGLVNILWDQLAFRQSWWTYPAFARSGVLWLLYVPSGLVAGGAAGLVGWRIIRRFQTPGLLLFLAVWTLWGVLHDFGGAYFFKDSALMAFAPGSAPVMADAALYASCEAIALAVIRLAGGPANRDPLAPI